MNKPYLSVVIPCFNEEKNLKRGVLEEVGDYLKKQKYSSEIIVSDDGSTDNSVKLIKQFFFKGLPRYVSKKKKNNVNFLIRNKVIIKLIENEHGGKPFAVKSGVMAAKGKIILFTDMDQSTPIDQVERLLPFFQKNYDIVIGSRGQSRQGFSFFRLLASSVFRFVRQALLLRNIIDTQCGFKAFKNEVAKDLFSRLLIFRRRKKTSGWRVGAFDVELLFIGQKRGYKIAEVPIVWEDKDIAGEKQRKFLKESKEMLKEILRVKLNDLKGLYD